MIEEKQYRQTKSPINSTLTVVQDKERRWGVIDAKGNIVVEFGKYTWIDGFQNGLAKVIGFDDTTGPNIIAVWNKNNEYKVGSEIERIARQGIINESGEEVLPLEYTVWKFYGKDYPTIKYFNGNNAYSVSFESLNPALKTDSRNEIRHYNHCYYDYYDNDYMSDTWDAMTDGMYGDMPEGFDGDFDFLGY